MLDQVIMWGLRSKLRHYGFDDNCDWHFRLLNDDYFNYLFKILNLKYNKVIIKIQHKIKREVIQTYWCLLAVNRWIAIHMMNLVSIWVSSFALSFEGWVSLWVLSFALSFKYWVSSIEFCFEFQGLLWVLLWVSLWVLLWVSSINFQV